VSRQRLAKRGIAAIFHGMQPILNGGIKNCP
jgi:hypothetical protein